MSNQGTRTTASTGNTIKQTGSVLIANPFVSSPRPTWMEKRDATFEVISARRAEELATKVPVDVTVTLPDGKTVPAKSWQTTPYDVAASISQGLADSVVVARVNYSSYVMDYDAAEDGVSGNDPMMDETPDDKKGKDSILWDMNRPLVGDCTVEFLKFNDSPEAQSVFWHSSAHILGEALERLFGAHLTIGPPLAGGFYYDSYLGLEGENGAERTLKEDDYKIIEKEVTAISKAKQRFQRLVVTKEEALELLSYNPFKAAIIQAKVPDGTRTSVYKNGDLIDLCRGPHVIHTGKIKAFVATRHSATQWLGNVKNDPLQRLYGISFPDKKQMKEWKENQEKFNIVAINVK